MAQRHGRLRDSSSHALPSLAAQRTSACLWSSRFRRRRYRSRDSRVRTEISTPDLAQLRSVLAQFLGGWAGVLRRRQPTSPSKTTEMARRVRFLPLRPRRSIAPEAPLPQRTVGVRVPRQLHLCDLHPYTRSTAMVEPVGGVWRDGERLWCTSARDGTGCWPPAETVLKAIISGLEPSRRSS